MLPRSTSVPPWGVWLITTSAGTVSLAWRMTSSSSPARASSAMAVCSGLLTTVGTVTCGTSSSPKYDERPNASAASAATAQIANTTQTLFFRFSCSPQAEAGQEARGSGAVKGTTAAGNVALIVLPLDHGFASDAISLLTEQDILGERLVRRQKRRKSADAFLAELATLSVGDMVVHLDHGIGRYEGLTSIPVGNSPHDCVALTYAGGDKLYVPVENLDVLSRYGGESDGVTLDRLGGEAWQRRKARMKERIREIAGEVLATCLLYTTPSPRGRTRTR